MLDCNPLEINQAFFHPYDENAESAVFMPSIDADCRLTHS